MMREQLDLMTNENNQLTSALQSAMEDCAHMSEKLLLSEQANDTLKVKDGQIDISWIDRLN